jgi:hypothetical protein
MCTAQKVKFANGAAKKETSEVGFDIRRSATEMVRESASLASEIDVEDGH